MRRLHIPPTFDTDYPLIPLDEEEKRPVMEGGGAALSRFRKRIESASIYEYFKLQKLDLYKVAETLFYKGGKLSRFGLVPKEGIDEQLAFEVLSSMLISPFPNYMQKESTVALALYNWYEEGTRDDIDSEPSFTISFKNPRTHRVDGLAFELLVGKNRN